MSRPAVTAQRGARRNAALVAPRRTDATAVRATANQLAASTAELANQSTRGQQDTKQGPMPCAVRVRRATLVAAGSLRAGEGRRVALWAQTKRACHSKASGSLHRYVAATATIFALSTVTVSLCPPSVTVIVAFSKKKVHTLSTKR